MTKKFLFGLMAIAGLFATSCQEKIAPVVNEGDIATVSFQVSTPEIATRAYSDGTTADVLQYAVYEVKGETETILTGYPKTTEINITTSVSLQLAVGSTYSVVFWAAATEKVPYTVDFVNQNVTVDYESALSNDETRDAFYSYQKFTVTGAKTEKVELKRPFAQLNIGTNDFQAAADAGLVPETSSVTVKNVFSTLNLATGVASGEVAATFGANAIPAGEKFPVTGYDYLAMNYLLVNTDKEVVDVEFTYTTADNDARTRTVGSVPVQRNYRTNIYGRILTTTVDVEVEIKPGFDGEDYPVEVWDGETLTEPEYDSETATYTVSHASELAYLAALVNGTITKTRAAASVEEYNIVLSEDIDLAGEEWTPIGFNPKDVAGDETYFTGTFDGNGKTIHNLKISGVDKGGLGLFGAVYNATIKNVTINNVDVKAVESETDPSDLSGATGNAAYIAGGHTGAVVGYDAKTGKVSFENVHVTGLIKIEGETRNAQGQRVGGIVGGRGSSEYTFKNVSVIGDEGSYIKGYCSTAGVIGQNQGVATFENVTTYIDVYAVTFGAGGIAGIARQGSVFTNCSSAGDIYLNAYEVQPTSYSANYPYRVGGIAGCWSDSATGVLTLVNCSYTGTLNSLDKEGNTPESFDYLGYVGRGYALKNCKGSTVTIDGVSFVQAENLDYGVYTIDGVYAVNATTLRWMDKKIAAGETFEGKTFKMIENVDLKNKQWSPIGGKNSFSGIFDGNGKTISNLKYYFDGDEYFVGLFGCVDNATVKNLTITNVDIKLTGDETWGHIGAVAGWAEGTSSFENITVNGDVMIEGEMTQNGSQRIGGVVGGNQGGNLTFSNVNVNASAGSYVKGYMQVGGLAGQLQGKASFVDCSSNIDVYAQQAFAGGIIGLAAGENPLTNCHTTGNWSVVAGRAGNVNDIQRVGGIAGGWADNLTTPLVLTGCTYEGTLSAKDAAGVEPTTYDYDGFVGRGYTVNDRNGSVVIINGKEYVQVSPGNYEIR